MKLNEFPAWIQAVLSTLGIRAFLYIVTLLVSGWFAVYVDRRKFAGRWHFIIRWTPKHAQCLFGVLQPEAHSEGRVAITYGHGPKKQDYWGIGYFELKSSTTVYARLCIELANMQVKRKIFLPTFPYFFRLALTELVLKSRIREQVMDFHYGPWVLYRMKFHVSTGNILQGKMVLEESGEEVGDIEASRTG